MKNIMVDLETMGNGANAAIIAIGAVEFDQVAGIGDKFYEVVDLASSMANGGIVDASTVMWWMKQSEAARGSFDTKGVSVNQALVNFAGWLENRAPFKELQIWGNGAAFDNVILSSAYRSAGIMQPWPFWGDRCYRTIKALYPSIEAKRVGTYHNAVDDAETQARHLITLLQEANS